MKRGRTQVAMVAIVLLISFASAAGQDGNCSSISNCTGVQIQGNLQPSLGVGPIDFSGANRAVTDEFKSLGVIFYGDGGPGSPAYIKTDTSNPTSPVLAGSASGFSGPVGAQFVDPVTMETVAVTSVTSNAGYFDSDNSTAMTGYDANGAVVDTIDNGTGRGIISMEVNAREQAIPGLPTLITQAEFASIGEDPAGFAIDLFGFQGCSLSGKVLFPPQVLGGIAVPGTFVALIKIVPPDNELIDLVVSDQNGWYCLSQPPAGTYALLAVLSWADGGPYFGLVQSFTIDDTMPQRGDVTLFEIN